MVSSGQMDTILAVLSPEEPRTMREMCKRLGRTDRNLYRDLIEMRRLGMVDQVDLPPISKRTPRMARKGWIRLVHPQPVKS